MPLGPIVCERSFHLYKPDGQTRRIVVRLGQPVRTVSDVSLPETNGKESCTFCCPFQITGLNHDAAVEGVFGSDAFAALQCAINFIGIRLDAWSRACGLINKQAQLARNPWIWNYPID